MNHATTLDLASFEDPAFHDKLERARLNATDRIGMLNSMGRLVLQSITLISLSIGVIVYSPWLFALLVLCVAPAFAGESHFAFLGYSLAHSLTPIRRELDYLRILGQQQGECQGSEDVCARRLSARSLRSSDRWSDSKEPRVDAAAPVVGLGAGDCRVASVTTAAMRTWCGERCWARSVWAR